MDVAIFIGQEVGTPRPVISEKMRIQVYREQGDYRYVDFKIELSPAVRRRQTRRCGECEGLLRLYRPSEATS